MAYSIHQIVVLCIAIYATLYGYGIVSIKTRDGQDLTKVEKNKQTLRKVGPFVVVFLFLKFFGIL